MAQDRGMSRQTPETRGGGASADSKHPKIREKLQQRHLKPMFISITKPKAQDQGTNSAPKKLASHSACRDRSRRSGRFEEELCSGMRCG